MFYNELTAYFARSLLHVSQGAYCMLKYFAMSLQHVLKELSTFFGKSLLHVLQEFTSCFEGA